MLSDCFEIAPIRFPVSENILVDTKIRFLSLLDDIFSLKTEKMVILSQTMFVLQHANMVMFFSLGPGYLPVPNKSQYVYIVLNVSM